MAFRETLEKHPKKILACVGVAVVIALIIGIKSSSPGPMINSASPVYFTDDDGKNWYSEDSVKISPSDHNGKTAVLCFVFKAKDGTKFVGYEEELPPEVIASENKKPASDRLNMLQLSDKIQLKRPGQSEWVSPSSPKGREILGNISGPDGSFEVTPVYP